MTATESIARTPHADHQVELRVDASAPWLASVRLLAGDLATRADFDLDTVADLKLAVDEACAELIRSALPGAVLTCTFAVRHDALTMTAVVPAAPNSEVDVHSFGWRVLTTLADEVEVLHSDASAPWPTLGMRLHTRRRDAAR